MGTHFLVKWTKKGIWLNVHSFRPNLLSPKRICDVVIGDETWITFYCISSKWSNSIWVGPRKDRLFYFHTGFQSRKKLYTILFSAQIDFWHLIFFRRRHQCLQIKIEITYVSTIELPKRKKILLLHDKASPHEVKFIMTIL